MNTYRALHTPEPDSLYFQWPNFPAKACPGFLGEFVNLTVKNSEADPSAVCITFLVRFCAEVFGFAPDCGPHILVGDTIHPPRLFAVICGNSSKSRKGTSRHPVSRLFNKKDSAARGIPTDLRPPARESGGPLSTGEGLAFTLKEETEEEREQWQQQNPGEPLRDKADKRLFIVDEEFSSALTCIKRTGNTLSMALRCFWDSGDYSPLTKSSPVAVRGAHVNILSHITAQELSACLDAIQAVNGFGNRFLWACARRTKLVPLPERMPDTQLTPLQQELWQTVALAQDLKELKLTSHAKELWEYIYAELSQETPGLVGSLISRAEAQTLRLALCYALLDKKHQIEEEHLQSACAMWNYCKESALYIFSHWGSNSLEEKIADFLKSGPLTSTELNAALGRNVPKSQLEPALQRLQAQHRIEIRKENRGNSRPTTIISLAHLR
ncbi:DUF3987 domain-containing protein [Desulfovibrio sp. OttesenSCG-928-C14]|nr:DUF3987 domain-containing protein [Desulfovibrio sp. OttesenSCG-928-C14]